MKKYILLIIIIVVAGLVLGIAMTSDGISILEKWKLYLSLLPAISAILLGLFLGKKVEENKINVLKEKEWQVRWAELFLKQAIEYDKNITNFIVSLNNISIRNQKFKDNDEDKIKLLDSEFKKLFDEHSQNYIRIKWQMENYVQFASKNNRENLLKKQEEISQGIQNLIDGKIKLEEFKPLQFEYNKLVRKVHQEILDSDLKKD